MTRNTLVTLAAAAAVLVAASTAGARATQLDVTIASGPEGTVTSTTATFAFTANVRTAAFECSLDGAAPRACTSPVTYTGLGLGAHTFLVTAESGRERASARRIWTIVAAPSPPGLPPPPPGPPPPPPPAPSAPETATLAVVTAGAGTVASAPAGISCPADCAESVAAGTPVGLTPTAAAGWTFAGWAGACSGKGACTVTVVGAAFVKATFEAPDQPALRLGGDLDRDGVPNTLDACPRTLARGPLVGDGCTGADLVAGNAALLGALEQKLDKTRARLGRLRALKGLTKTMGKDWTNVERGLGAVSDGEICAGARTVHGAVGTLLAHGAQAGKKLTDEQKKLLAEALPPGDDEPAERDFQWAALHYALGQLDDALDGVKELRRGLDAACAGLGGKLRVRGRITKTDDARGLIGLASGLTFQLPADRLGTGVAEGVQVEVAATRRRQGPALVDELTVLSKADSQVSATLKPCVSLRIAPAAQDLLNQPNPVLHAPSGYERNGTHWLEAGMKLGATPKCAGATGRWSLAIELLDDGKTSTVAPDLTSQDGTVPLPGGDGPDPMVLTVTLRRQGSDCTVGATQSQSFSRVIAARTAQGTPCPVVVKSVTKYTIRVLNAGAYATAAYASTLYDLDENAPQNAKVTGFSSLHSSITSGTFEGLGFKPTGNQQKSALQLIQQNELFALYPGDVTPDPETLFPLDSWGVDHKAGLWWPRVVGKRHGRPFWYRSKLPTLVTDVLAFCPPANCFYADPWAFGVEHKVTQGNSGPDGSSHEAGTNQEFAFDLWMPDGTEILATRGGIVGDVVESNTQNFNPCNPATPNADGPSNFVRIDHADGTFSYYAHVQPGSVVPEEGDYVGRGAPLALVGDIGRACGAHLHYQVAIDKTNTIYGQTTQIRFVTWVKGQSSPYAQTCYIPQGGDWLISTNG